MAINCRVDLPYIGTHTVSGTTYSWRYNMPWARHHGMCIECMGTTGAKGHCGTKCMGTTGAKSHCGTKCMGTTGAKGHCETKCMGTTGAKGHCWTNV